MTASPVLLVPGFWLGAWAWDRVVPRLAAAGHAVEALTLPGLSDPDADRGRIGLEDHVAEVVERLRGSAAPAVLVAHSGAGPVAYSAVDRVPDLVSRIVYVDSGPLPDGEALRPDLGPDVVDLPLPSWDELEAEGSSVAGLSEEDLATFRRRAVPHPAGAAREPLRLSNPARYDVPVTVVACSMPAEMVSGLAAQGHPMFRELAALQVSYVDLPTGHWPMWSRPADLADVILSEASVSSF